MYGGPLYQAPQRIAPSVFRWGGIFGVVIAVLGVGNALLQSFAGSMGPSGDGFALVSCVLFFAFIGLLFVSGYMAARETGRLAAGTWAGVVAGAIPASFLGVVLSIQALTTELSTHPGRSSAYIFGYGGGILIVLLILLVVGGIVGAGLGVLGALIGRARFRSAHPPVYQAYPPYVAPYPPYAANPAVPPYPDMPPPPYPPYPAYPPYPVYAPVPPRGQAPAYSPPPPDVSRPAQPGYPYDESDSGTGWLAPGNTEPPTTRW